MARAAAAAEAAEEAAGVKSHFAKLTNNSPAFLLALVRTAGEPQLPTLCPQLRQCDGDAATEIYGLPSCTRTPAGSHETNFQTFRDTITVRESFHREQEIPFNSAKLSYPPSLRTAGFDG